MIAALALAAAVVDLPDAAIRVRDVVRGTAVGDVVIARMPGGRREVTLGGSALAALVRRAVPGLSVAPATTTFRRVIAVPVATPLAPLPAPDIARGDEVTLVARGGAVRVERRVTAMQAGRNGARLFVRDAGGRVFAAGMVR